MGVLVLGSSSFWIVSAVADFSAGVDAKAAEPPGAVGPAGAPVPFSRMSTCRSVASARS
ncbi:hypothetical protein ACFWNQ_05300 [Streptomyces virginiae]|uniref:hypothetical protein n=1 Tax=Streptomyces virginiae TaxID=1961 RepID=UPI00364AA18D